jgi:phosphohistidine phosphatase SixA
MTLKASIHAGSSGFTGTTTERPNDCSSGSRQLNDEGRAQSRLIGQTIKEFNIPIGEVYSSSFCRCEETAKLAFDRVTSTD